MEIVIQGAAIAPGKPATGEVYITDALAGRRRKRRDHQSEKRALHELAARMAAGPADLLPALVDLAMEMTGAISAGLSLYDADAAPDIFRWHCLRGSLASFEGAVTPRDDSPCGVTLDRNRATLIAHPERLYDWIAAHDLVLDEVLLVPLSLSASEPLGTLWMVSPAPGHFDGGDAAAASELAGFAGLALRMIRREECARRALDEQETVAREMSHRLKNLFAMTEGMIHVSAKNADSPDDMAEALSGRVRALASAHSLLRRKVSDLGGSAGMTDLGGLVGSILKAHDESGDRPSPFLIEGPAVGCGDHATNGIALLLHELATNAVKYGALKQRDGQVAIRWSVTADQLSLHWRESGGPSLDGTPEKVGFGTTLVERTVTRQLRGSLHRSWRPEGLEIVMLLPLDRVAS